MLFPIINCSSYAFYVITFFVPALVRGSGFSSESSSSLDLNRIYVGGKYSVLSKMLFTHFCLALALAKLILGTRS